MKILLTANIPYFPALGGANKINRRMLEGLARRGHTVEVVVPALGTPTRMTHDGLLDALRSRSGVIDVRTTNNAEERAVIEFTLEGVAAHAVIEAKELRVHLRSRIEALTPDVIIVTSEDPSQSLLDTALRARADHVAYMGFTSSFLPFGPQAFFPSDRRAKLFKQVRSIGAMSSYLANYMKEWGGLDAEVVHMPIFDRAPFPKLGSFDNPYVTIINPCSVKGLPVFVALARLHPDIRFAAVPLWGTTKEDVATLESIPNVTLLDAVEDIDVIYKQTRVLLMPSLWAETFGMACVEAMLRGIPVLASNMGGLPEAKQGTNGVLPVQPIEEFTSRLDGNMLPIGRCPEQDVAPWSRALVDLLASRDAYDRESTAASQAAMRYYESASDERIEDFLQRALSRALAS